MGFFPAPLAAQAQPERSIVFLAPEADDPAVAASLREALAAQLADVSVRPVFDSEQARSVDLIDFVEQSRSLAERENAVGVFWLDTARPDEWMLYLLDPAGERLLVRRAGSSAQSVAAAVEAVAVIIKGSTVALLGGHALGLPGEGEAVSSDSRWVQIDPETQGRVTEPVGAEVSPEPGKQEGSGPLLVRIDSPPTSAPKIDAQGTGLRLAAAYRGADFAPETGWQSGVGLRASWIWLVGPYAGAGYTFTGAESVRRGLLELSVQRHPVELFGGYRFRNGRIRFDAELGAVLDILSRSTAEPRDGFGVSEDRSRLVVGIQPRTRIEYTPFGATALFSGLGVSFFTNNFEYVGDLPAREVLLAPRPVQLEIEAGLAVYLR